MRTAFLVLALGCAVPLSCSLLGGDAPDLEKVAALEIQLKEAERGILELTEQVQAVVDDPASASPELVQILTATLPKLQADLEALKVTSEEPDGDIGWTELLLAVGGAFLARGRPSKGPLAAAVNAVMPKKPQIPA